MKSAIVKTVGRAKRFTISTGMTCGSAEAENRTYKLIVGRTGRRWLVAIQPDEADNTYVEGVRRSFFNNKYNISGDCHFNLKESK